MTRKDYILIAEAIKDSVELIKLMHQSEASQQLALLAVESTAARIAKSLQRDNPRFDRHVFLTACGF